MNDARRRRVGFWGGLTLLLVVLLAFALWPRRVMVDTAVVDEGPLRVTLEHEGRTRVRDRYVVSAPVAGRVQRIELEPGDPVAAGKTVVATFLPAVPPLLDVRASAEGAARVQAAEAALARARAERERARTEAGFAAVERDRARRLEEAGVISAQALEAAETEAAARARALAAGEAAVNGAAHELEVARAALITPAAPASGSRTGQALALRAPADGVVLRRLRESEAVVPQGEPLLEIADTSSLEVIADFLSADAVRIEPGQKVSIEQWGGPAPLNGRVRRIEPSGFLKVSALGVEEQRVWVVIDFDDPRSAWQALGDGYRVEARVVVWERARVVRAPSGSLFRDGDGWAVFTVEDGRAARRDVQVGQRGGTTAEILAGLRSGEVVIVHPPDAVGDGARVAARAAGGSR